ncbi:MAG: hypothetical protein PWQ28_864, partial [Candidatus Woesearchaeota archaeon]|nr:hypothetical protein [Candidatus Woesearchaeota archaeon]
SNTANSNNNDGISLQFSSNNTIGNNTANSNGFGISLESSSNNTIGNNTANSNLFGIYLSSSSNNTIRQNNESLSYYGFYLSSSSNNTIHNNLAELNVYGIYLESSSDNNFSNFDFNHNLKSSVLDSQILDESIERTFPKNQETTLVFNTIYPNGTSWTDYNYSLLFYPELSYTVINNSDNFSIKFTPEKEGIYTLSLNVSVGHNNEVRNIVFLVGEPSLGSERYYMYDEFPTKGQQAFGSTGSMYPNEPTDAQERSSDGLIQYSPNEIVNIYPIIKNVSVGLFYSSNETGSLGIEKYAKYGSTKDYETELPSTGEGNYDFAVKNFTNINITSDYAWRFYWLAFKVNGSQISVISNDTRKTYADFDYLYAGPEIIYFGESSGSDIRNIRLLSSVFNDDSGRSVTLEFDGDGSLDLVLNLSDDNYTIFYDDIPCNDNENCTLNLKNNGEINLTLKLGSYHKLDVVGTIPPEIPSSRSSGTTYPTYRIDEEELSNGYQKVMRKNWRILFRIDGESHTFKVEDVTKTTAGISISSETQEAILSIGEEKKFEITGDDYYDILVRLNSIDSTNEIYLKANFTIQSIHEEIIPLEEEEIEEEINETEEIIEEPIEEEPIEEEETIPEEIEEEINETIDEIPQETIHELEKEKMKLTALWIAMFVIVILIIFMFIYRRSGKE